MENFNLLDNDEVHHCTAHRDGDWITFRCPQCSDYITRMNIKTGELKPSKNISQFRHTGLHVPVSVQLGSCNPN